jgi:uncharacterized protein
MAEIRGVLQEKFHWSDEMLGEAIAGLRDFTQLVRPTQTLSVIKEDPDDDRVLECAMASDSQFIISGDKRRIAAINQHAWGYQSDRERLAMP